MTQHVRVFAFAWARVCAPTKKTTFFRWEKPRVTARWPIFGDLLTVAYLRWPNNPLTYFRWPTSGDLLTVTYFGWPTFGDHKVTTDTMLWRHCDLTSRIPRSHPAHNLFQFFFMIKLVHGSSKGLFCGPLQFEGVVLWSISGLFILFQFFWFFLN